MLYAIYHLIENNSSFKLATAAA